MKKAPANWKECVKMSLQSGIAPQFIAEAFDIKSPQLTHEEPIPKFKDISDAAVELHKAMELGLRPTMLEILDNILEEHAHTIDSCKFVLEQALYLGYKDVALKAVNKMAPMLS